MMPIRPGVRRLFRLATRHSDTATDVDEEIRFHIEERTTQLMANGLDPAVARAEAERRFGVMNDAREQLLHSAIHREKAIRTHDLFDACAQDLRFAVRSLRRSLAFLAVTTTCLALGIGANVAIFSVIDAVLLKPFPFAAPASLVSIWPDGAVPPGIHEILQRDAHSYTSLAGYESGRQSSVTGAGDPMRLLVAKTTVNFFSTLGVQAAFGRAFRAGEEKPGVESVAILSHALWTDRFGGDSTVIGRSVRIDGSPHRIVGVMAPAFRFPAAAISIWTPVQAAPGTPAYWWSTYLRLVGRLEPGTTAEAAQAEAAVLLPRARAAFPMRMPDEWGRGVRVESLQHAVTGSSRPTLLLLLGAVGLVLLTACVNVATLYIGRASSRAREIAVRAALGGGRARIVRLLLTESVVVAALGAAVGLALAFVAVRTIVTMLPEGTPRIDEIAIDGRAVAFTLLLMVLSAVAFGLLPAWRASRSDLASSLRSDGRSGGGARQLRVSWVLAAAQLSLAVLLVCGSGLLIKSMWKLQQSDLGFRTEGAMTVQIPLPSFPNDTAHRAPAFHDELLDRVRAIPGVESAALTSALPFGEGIQNAAMEVEAHPTAAGAVPPNPHLTVVSNDYFTTLDIPLVRGRAFTESDRDGSTRVAMIDETAARTLWPGANAIGQRLRYVWNQEWFTVVGIARNVKHDSLSSVAEPSMYLPMKQTIAREMRLVITADADASVLASSIRGAARTIDASVPVGMPRPLRDVVRGSAARPRFTTMLFTLFAGVALMLGAAGIYGVMSAGVARRTREIGVRMAIGATQGQVASMVLKESLGIAAAGVVVGMVAAIAAARWLRGMLYGVQAADGTVMIAVAVLLGVVAVGAAVAPARRAAGVDPLVAMRAD